MMWMQDVEYTDFIYWQETETFINGVASTSGSVELFFHEKVDRDSSLVIYDGKEVDLSQEHTFIDIQKEGITQLVYILKDVDGYALQEGEKTILLDTTMPDIILKVKNQTLLDTLPLEKDEIVHVQILEENMEEIHVYVDDKEVEVEGLEFDVNVHKENRELKIICKDIAGNEVERRMAILPIVYPESTLHKTIYTKDNHFELKLNSMCTQPYRLHVYCDSKYYYSLDLENTDHALLDLSKNGQYTFVVEHKEYPQFKKKLDGIVFYSNIKPVISLQTSTQLSNKDVAVNVTMDAPYMESGYIEIELNGDTRRYPISQTFILSTMDNQDLIYNVHAYVKDAFGHEARDEVRVRIDRKAPVSNLYIDNEPVQNRMEIKKIPNINYVLGDLDASMRVEYYLNDERMNMDVEKIFNRMKKDDVLKVITFTTDALFNLEKKRYEFVFVPEKEVEMVSKSEQKMETDEIVEFERIWIVNDHNEVVLKENKQRIQKASKPVIHYTRKKNKVQIWVKEKLDYVLVNGKKMHIDKDVMGHDFVEISLKKRKTKIEVKAINDVNESAILKKEEVRNKIVRMSFVQKFWMKIRCLFKL